MRPVALALAAIVVLLWPTLRPFSRAMEDVGDPPPVPCLVQPGDTNGDGFLDVSDAVYLLRHLFGGGEPPVAFCQSDIETRLAALEALAASADAMDLDPGMLSTRLTSVELNSLGHGQTLSRLDPGRIGPILDKFYFPRDRPSWATEGRSVIVVDADLWMRGEIR